MINIYGQNCEFVKRADSIRGAARITYENTRTIRNRLNRPAIGYEYNYYTNDNRGYLIRLAHEISILALSTEYPTDNQIKIFTQILKELKK